MISDENVHPLCAFTPACHVGSSRPVSSRLLRAIAVAACFLLLGTIAMPIAQAQDSRGRVTVNVTDQSGAAVTHATVVLTNMNTGVAASKTSEVGTVIFDFVVPGKYAVSVQAPDFRKYIKENIDVLTAGDVTVSAQLTVGTVNETITVAETGSELAFNTSTMEATVVGQMLQDVPVLARNPFTLALLNPAVVNDYWDVEHRQPFYMWSSNGLNIGGDTAGHNDMLLDGVPLGVASRGSYMPSMDSTQEVAVQQNAVDAEYGFSAGGILNVSMKSGTNDFHGTAYYFGRNPALNAMADRVNQTPNPIRNHIYGGTLGNPILKNKLFTFNTFEGWRNIQPLNTVMTLPNAAEHNGDFSGALTPDGTQRAIYDPMSTQFNPNTQAVTRTPFPGNVIPAGRIDPSAKVMMNDIWAPNSGGDNPSGVNNYRTTFGQWMHYWNYSNRTDYNINAKWRVYTRFSKYQTRQDIDNYGNSPATGGLNGGIMDALNAAADVLYVASPSTVFNLRYGTTYVEDDFYSGWAKTTAQTFAKIWPNNNWYEPMLKNEGSDNIYYPYLEFDGLGSANFGVGGTWIVHERQHNYQFSVNHDHGRHHLKFGQTLRYNYNQNAVPGSPQFYFNGSDTASTFLSPDLTQSGDPYASFLVGGMSYGQGNISPFRYIHEHQWAAYVQDDIHLTPKLTLNLGLRWEYESAPREENGEFSRYLDLNQPISQILANPPDIPSSISQYVSGGYRFNGHWMFTDSSHQDLFNANHHVLLPRLGLAYRLNEKTAVRVGYARYAMPRLSMFPQGDYIPIYGVSKTTYTTPEVAGVPTSFIGDPFPSSNPLQQPTGKALGVNQNLGDSANWMYQNLKPPINDRFNVSVQRQLPGAVKLDATFFMNYGKDVLPTGPGTMWGTIGINNDLNMVNPNLIYSLKGLTDQPVANPFYNYLTPDQFPGSLRYQQTIPMNQLLRTYPQYETLYAQYIPGFHSHYKALQLQAQRSFGGLSFTFGYSINRSYSQQWFNALSQWADIQQSTPSNMNVTHTSWIPSVWPRQRITSAATWELPFGRGKRFGGQMNPALDFILGGWTTSHVFTWSTGQLLSFSSQSLAAPTDAPAAYRQRGNWFDTSGFALAQPYTPRLNPWVYPGLAGPNNWDLDSTLAKYFVIRENLKVEFRLEAYNSLNGFVPTDPVTTVGSGSFGQTTDQKNYGRQVQYTLRIHF